MNNRIAQLRKALGLSQMKLANIVGVSRISISKIETGKCVPGLKLASNIADALDKSLYEVFDLDNSGAFTTR